MSKSIQCPLESYLRFFSTVISVELNHVSISAAHLNKYLSDTLRRVFVNQPNVRLILLPFFLFSGFRVLIPKDKLCGDFRK